MKTFAVLALLAVYAYAQSATPELETDVILAIDDPISESQHIREPVQIVKRETDPSGSEPLPDIHIEIIGPNEERETRQKRQYDGPEAETLPEPQQPQNDEELDSEKRQYRACPAYNEGEVEQKPEKTEETEEIEDTEEIKETGETAPQNDDEEYDDKGYRRKRDTDDFIKINEEADDEGSGESSTTIPEADNETEQVTEDDASQLLALAETTTEVPEADVKIKILGGPTESKNRQAEKDTQSEHKQEVDEKNENKPEESTAQNVREEDDDNDADDDEDQSSGNFDDVNEDIIPLGDDFSGLTPRQQSERPHFERPAEPYDEDSDIIPLEDYKYREKRDVATQENANRTRRSYVEEHGYPDCTCNHQYHHLPLYTALHKHCSCPDKPHPPHPNPHPPCHTCGHNHGPHVPCHEHAPFYQHHHHMQAVPQPVPVHDVHPVPIHHVRHDVHHHFVPRKPHYRKPCDRPHHSHYDHVDDDDYKH